MNDFDMDKRFGEIAAVHPAQDDFRKRAFQESNLAFRQGHTHRRRMVGIRWMSIALLITIASFTAGRLSMSRQEPRTFSREEPPAETTVASILEVPVERVIELKSQTGGFWHSKALSSVHLGDYRKPDQGDSAQRFWEIYRRY